MENENEHLLDLEQILEEKDPQAAFSLLDAFIESKTEETKAVAYFLKVAREAYSPEKLLIGESSALNDRVPLEPYMMYNKIYEFADAVKLLGNRVESLKKNLKGFMAVAKNMNLEPDDPNLTVEITEIAPVQVKAHTRKKSHRVKVSYKTED